MIVLHVLGRTWEEMGRREGTEIKSPLESWQGNKTVPCSLLLLQADHSPEYVFELRITQDDYD